MRRPILLNCHSRIQTALSVSILTSAITLLSACSTTLNTSADETDQLSEARWPDLQKMSPEYDFAEGPVWMDGRLIVSDLAGNAVYTLAEGNEISARRPSRFANGHTLDEDGNLIEARHGSRDVVRIERDGTVTILASDFKGNKFNSPNDVARAPNGDIWFTDPPFGLTPPYGEDGQVQELAFSGVYRIDMATGQLALITSDIALPNGIDVSRDGRRAFVSDSSTGAILKLDLTQFNSDAVEIGRFPAKDGNVVDGLSIGGDGHLYIAAPGRIVVMTVEGDVLSELPMPISPTDVVWGGANGGTLFITGPGGVWSTAVPEFQ